MHIILVSHKHISFISRYINIFLANCNNIAKLNRYYFYRANERLSHMHYHRNKKMYLLKSLDISTQVSQFRVLILNMLKLWIFDYIIS